MLRRLLLCLCLSLVIALSAIINSCSNPPESTGEKLARLRQGTWFNGSGTYTVWTDNHYFVISYEGDSVNSNIYCGASQVSYCDLGLTRAQTLRMRKMPRGDLSLSRNTEFTQDHTEARIEIDTTLFAPNTCIISDGVIYDAIIEQKDDYILLASCDGDREKIYSNGTAVYLPADGGEYYSYRIDTL